MDIKDLRHLIQESLSIELETSWLTPDHITAKLKWDGHTFSESQEQLQHKDPYE